MTPEQKGETRFCVFRSPEWGIRALVKIIQTYERKYSLDTVRGIINRWADGLDTRVFRVMPIKPETAALVRDAPAGAEPPARDEAAGSSGRPTKLSGSSSITVPAAPVSSAARTM